MRRKIKLFRESLRLVWASSPGWATANILVSVIRSILPLALIWLLKILIDDITREAASGSGINPENVIWKIIAVAAVYFLDEASSDLSNYIRKKQSTGS